LDTKNIPSLLLTPQQSGEKTTYIFVRKRFKTSLH
jgi:hypothetical protein